MSDVLTCGLSLSLSFLGMKELSSRIILHSRIGIFINLLNFQISVFLFKACFVASAFASLSKALGQNRPPKFRTLGSFGAKASDFDDHNILFNAALYTVLSDNLKLRLSLTTAHDSQPPKNLAANPIIDVEKTDTEYSVSFVYEL